MHLGLANMAQIRSDSKCSKGTTNIVCQGWFSRVVRVPACSVQNKLCLYLGDTETRQTKDRY